MRRGPEQDAREHRVDARRLAGAGRAGDEQVRHLRQVGPDRPARDILAQPDRQRRPVRRGILEHVAQMDDPPPRVRNLDPDRLLAGNRRQNPDVRGGQRVREIVLELRDLGHLRPGRQPDLVAGDVRTGDTADHLCLDPEVTERLDQRGGHLLLTRGIGLGCLSGRPDEETRPGHVPLEVRVVGDVGAVAPLGSEVLRIDLRLLLFVSRHWKSSGIPPRWAEFRNVLVIDDLGDRRRLDVSGADDELRGIGLGRNSGSTAPPSSTTPLSGTPTSSRADRATLAFAAAVAGGRARVAAMLEDERRSARVVRRRRRRWRGPRPRPQRP